MDEIDRIVHEFNEQNDAIAEKHDQGYNSADSFVRLEDIEIHESDDDSEYYSNDSEEDSSETLSIEKFLRRSNNLISQQTNTDQTFPAMTQQNIGQNNAVLNSPASFSQPAPSTPAPLPPTILNIKNKERYGTLTGVMLTNVNSPLQPDEMGITPKGELYCTNHDPGDKRIVDDVYQRIYDISSCTIPFKYGIWAALLIIAINLIFIAAAAVSYEECGDSNFPLPLYIIASSTLHITISFYNIVVYYIDCCWEDIKIFGVPIFYMRNTHRYRYECLFEMALATFIPTLDSIVGIIFLVMFRDSCSWQIWSVCLIYTIICCPVRSIKLR